MFRGFPFAFGDALGVWNAGLLRAAKGSATLVPAVEEDLSNPYRMPGILRADNHEAWLAGTAAEAKRVLQQYLDDRMHAYRVSARVNSTKNDDAELAEPVESANA